ncbi:MAG: molecular chaperone [Neisseriaceae bacterium]|nr:molecular chaperone [Neisseriaceae bacterium]
MPKLTVSAAVCLILLGVGPFSQASATLLGTRLFHYCPQAKQTLTFVPDPSFGPSVLTTWIDARPQQLLPQQAQAPFATFPAQLNMPAQGQQKIVLMYVGPPEACPKTQEAVYYFYFMESPVKALKQPQPTHYLSMIKLFLRPAHLRNNLKGGGAQLGIDFDPQTAQFIVHNPSPYHVTISRWQRASGSAKPLAEPVMVPPHSSLRHPALRSTPLTLGTPIVIHTLDDFGRSHSSSHTLRPH